MKKTLLMMAAALTAWSASAQLYVTGANVDGQGGAWDPAAPLEVTAQNDSYTFQATGNFKISTARGNWDTFNAQAFKISGGWNKGTSTATATLEQGNTDISTPMSNTKITYSVKSDMSSITATLPDGMTFDGAPAPDFYLIGTFNGWTLADAAWKMTRNGNVYTITTPADITVNDTATEGWKINNGSWDLGFGQGEPEMPVMGTVYNLAENGGNLTTSIPAGTKVTFTYNESGTSTLLLEGEGGGSSEVTTPDHLYIVGALSTSNWTPDNTPEMTKEGNTFSISEVELVGDANFSFLTVLGGWDAVNQTDRYGAEAGFGGVDLTFVDGVATAPVVKNQGDVKSFNAVPGKYDISVTFEAASVTLKVTKIGEAPVVNDLVLTGTFNDWSPNDQTYKMTKNGDTYTITLPSMAAGTEFKVKTAEDNWVSNWGAEGDPSWTEGQPVAVTTDVAMNAWLNSGCNFLISEDLSNVTITFVRNADNAQASTLTVTADATTDPTPVPTDLVLTGTFNGWNENDPAYKMTADGNTYTFTMASLAAEEEFKIKTAEEGWATSWGAEGDPSWTEALDVDITPNTAMNAWFDSGCNFRVAEALHNVTITFVRNADNTQASTLTVAGTSAIEAVEAAAAEATAEYYNLQGIRILAPEAGQLYIVNRAGKISKEIAR